MQLLTQDIRKRLPPLRAQDSLGGKAVAHVKFFTPDSNWTYLIQGVLTDCDHGVEAGHVFDDALEDLAKEVREFAVNWNQSDLRDMSFRDDPGDMGRKVVVAGERSWGDEPSGGGYQMLKKAFGLGIAQLLGVS